VQSDDRTTRTEAERLLEREGIDVDDLRSEFVSYQAIRTYLRSHREAEPPTGDGPTVDEAVETIRRLDGRLTSVATDRFSNLDDLSVGTARPDLDPGLLRHGLIDLSLDLLGVYRPHDEFAQFVAPLDRLSCLVPFEDVEDADQSGVVQIRVAAGDDVISLPVERSDEPITVDVEFDAARLGVRLQRPDVASQRHDGQQERRPVRRVSAGQNRNAGGEPDSRLVDAPDVLRGDGRPRDALLCHGSIVAHHGNNSLSVGVDDRSRTADRPPRPAD
jgi:hypothetical protein